MPDTTTRVNRTVIGGPVYQIPESLRNRGYQPPTQPTVGQPQSGVIIPQGFQLPQNPANPANPTVTAGTGLPQTRITLPEVFEPKREGPSTVPPNTLKMPDAGTPTIDFPWNPSVNWSDFLSLAHNRYQR